MMKLIKNMTKPIDDYVISPSEGIHLLKTHSEAILLDVRTKEEFLIQRIPNAVLLPVDQIYQTVDQIYPSRDTIFIIYCRRGVRSEYARRIMKHLGYLNVYDMGGIIDWPYDTISG